MASVRTVLLLIRVIHSLFGMVFLSCIGVVYYSVFTRETTMLLLPAIVLLVIEGTVLFANHGQCPLHPLHARYGDEKGFFGLFLPTEWLPYVNRVLFSITILGFILLYGIV